jgi:hypothetical protein
MPTSEPDEYAGPLPEVVPRLAIIRRLVTATVRSFLRHNGLTSSAALAFFFLMSLFPFLIFLASALALLPIPHLATRMIHLVSHFVPDQTMPMVDSMLTSTMHPNNGLLSAGFILAVLAASNAIASMATALNTIYEVAETRSFWQERLSAIYVTFCRWRDDRRRTQRHAAGTSFWQGTGAGVQRKPYLRDRLAYHPVDTGVDLRVGLDWRALLFRTEPQAHMAAADDRLSVRGGGLDWEFRAAGDLPPKVLLLQCHVWHAGVVHRADAVVAVCSDGNSAGSGAERGAGEQKNAAEAVETVRESPNALTSLDPKSTRNPLLHCVQDFAVSPKISFPYLFRINGLGGERIGAA